MNKELAENNLVIIGGGFAGITLAKKLEKNLPPDWEIYILSQTNFITYNPLLPEVIGASILPSHVQAPIRQMIKRTRVRMVTVDRIDYQAKKVYYHNNEPGEIKFDQLVIAPGVRANVNMMPGIKQHSLPLKTVGDALFIRNKVIERLEQATIHPDPEHRKHLTTFIIIGGGFSGVETAGELQDFLNCAEKYYKNVENRSSRIILLHGTDRLLPELSEKLGRVTERTFAKRGIDVRLNTRATSIEKDKVILQSGEVITGGTIICTIGTTPHPFVADEIIPQDRGRIIVQGDMSITDNPGIWALGDCALVPNALDGKLCPPTAQVADRQARHLAKNIIAWTTGGQTKPFSFKPVGMFASIGHNKAVAEIYGVCISGFIAFLIWRAIYLMKVPTLERKSRLFLEWSWTMLFPPDISHLGFKRTDQD